MVKYILCFHKHLYSFYTASLRKCCSCYVTEQLNRKRRGWYVRRGYRGEVVCPLLYTWAHRQQWLARVILTDGERGKPYLCPQVQGNFLLAIGTQTCDLPIMGKINPVTLFENWCSILCVVNIMSVVIQLSKWEMLTGLKMWTSWVRVTKWAFLAVQVAVSSLSPVSIHTCPNSNKVKYYWSLYWRYTLTSNHAYNTYNAYSANTTTTMVHGTSLLLQTSD